VLLTRSDLATPPIRIEESCLLRTDSEGLWYTQKYMLPLEHLHVDVLLLILLATASSIVGLRVTAMLGKRHVARQSERAIERAKA